MPKAKVSKAKAAPAAKKPLFPYDESAMLPNHVMLDLKLCNLGLGQSCKHRFDVTTPIFMVKRLLVERFGRMASLSIYKDIEAADGEITDDRLSLRDCGIVGGPGAEEPPVQVMYFDYRPFAFAEPVLLAEHRSGTATAYTAAASASSASASATATGTMSG